MNTAQMNKVSETIRRAESLLRVSAFFQDISHEGVEWDSGMQRIFCKDRDDRPLIECPFPVRQKHYVSVNGLVARAMGWPPELAKGGSQ